MTRRAHIQITKEEMVELLGLPSGTDIRGVQFLAATEEFSVYVRGDWCPPVAECAVSTTFRIEDLKRARRVSLHIPCATTCCDTGMRSGGHDHDRPCANFGEQVEDQQHRAARWARNP